MSTPRNTVYTKSFRVQSTTSGITTAWSLTMPDPALWSVEMWCIGRDQAGVERAQYRRHMLVYRQAGNATIQGSVETVGTDIETNATLNATLGVSGTDIGSSVTGLAATTIDWAFYVTILEIVP